MNFYLRTKPTELELWTASAVLAAEKLFAYPQLISDHRELALRAFEDGEDPADFAKDLGEELDLITVEDWFGPYGAPKAWTAPGTDRIVITD